MKSLSVFLLTDNMTLIANLEVVLRQVTLRFSKATKLLGTEVNFNKRVILYQPVLHPKYHIHPITSNLTKMEMIQNFTYLGMLVWTEKKAKQSKGNQAFSRLDKCVWRTKPSWNAQKECLKSLCCPLFYRVRNPGLYNSTTYFY